MTAFLLCICVACNGFTSVFLKLYQKKNGMTYRSAALFTGVMTGSIALFSLLISGFRLEKNLPSLFLSVWMGMLYALTMPMYGKAMEHGSIGLCGVFLNLGALLFPFLYGTLFLSEEVGVLRWIGFAAALSAVLLQIPGKSSATSATSAKSANLKFFLCGISIFTTNGLFCALLKAQTQLAVVAPTAQVLFYAGLSGCLFSFAGLLIRRLSLRRKTGGGIAQMS